MNDPSKSLFPNAVLAKYITSRINNTYIFNLIFKWQKDPNLFNDQ